MISSGKPGVLIIDDEQETADLLRKYIEKQGYTAYAAYNGNEGLTVIKNHRIGIIFCDICMPELNGIDFLRALRSFNVCAQVVMVTAYPNVSNCMESLQHDVCEYLVKPIPRENILKSLHRAERNLAEKKEMIYRGMLHKTNNKKQRFGDPN